VRRVLARLALGLGLIVAGWALVEAVGSLRSKDGASRVAVGSNEAAGDSQALPFTDPGPSGKQEKSPRRTSKRSGADSNAGAGEFVHANTPVVIPPGASEIGFEPAPEAPTAETRSVPGRQEREAPATAPSHAPEAAPPVAGTITESPLGTPATAEDEAITAEVRRKLEGASSRRIQVSTRGGVVTLSGAVDTEQEKSQAIEAARQTPGVSRVEDRIVVLVS
jgi:hyperosmotically inducible periplasmic protein